MFNPGYSSTLEYVYVTILVLLQDVYLNTPGIVAFVARHLGAVLWPINETLEIYFGAWCLSSAKRFVFILACIESTRYSHFPAKSVNREIFPNIRNRLYR